MSAIFSCVNKPQKTIGPFSSFTIIFQICSRYSCKSNLYSSDLPYEKSYKISEVFNCRERNKRRIDQIQRNRWCLVGLVGTDEAKHGRLKPSIVFLQNQMSEVGSSKHCLRFKEVVVTTELRCDGLRKDEDNRLRMKGTTMTMDLVSKKNTTLLISHCVQ